MIVRTHRSFDKAFARLPNDLQRKTLALLDKFIKNPHDPSLGTHKLHGKLEGKSSFSITNSIRVIYKRIGKEIVLLLDIGYHDQVY